MSPNCPQNFLKNSNNICSIARVLNHILHFHFIIDNLKTQWN
nr:MAG TPA: hypothetical protein [Caudoviricetes sp.]